MSETMEEAKRVSALAEGATGIMVKVSLLNSLITTIESQRDQLKANKLGLLSVGKIMEMQRLKLESQKVELDRIKMDCNYWNNEHSKETERADKLQKKIESLKAITELQERQIKELTISLKQESYADENPQYSDYVVKIAMDRAMQNGTT